MFHFLWRSAPKRVINLPTMNRPARLLLIAAAMAIASISAWVRYQAAQNSIVTADKVAQYTRSVDFGALSGGPRPAALHQLEQRINNLTLEERRTRRMTREWRQGFDTSTHAD